MPDPKWGVEEESEHRNCGDLARAPLDLLRDIWREVAGLREEMQQGFRATHQQMDALRVGIIESHEIEYSEGRLDEREAWIARKENRPPRRPSTQRARHRKPSESSHLRVVKVGLATVGSLAAGWQVGQTTVAAAAVGAVLLAGPSMASLPREGEAAVPSPTTSAATSVGEDRQVSSRTSSRTSSREAPGPVEPDADRGRTAAPEQTPTAAPPPEAAPSTSPSPVNTADGGTTSGDDAAAERGEPSSTPTSSSPTSSPSSSPRSNPTPSQTNEPCLLDELLGKLNVYLNGG